MCETIGQAILPTINNLRAVEAVTPLRCDAYANSFIINTIVISPYPATSCPGDQTLYILLRLTLHVKILFFAKINRPSLYLLP